jgi:hypothetical protein
MKEKGLTKVKMKAIDPQNFLAPQKILKLPRAYESLNPGLCPTHSPLATCGEWPFLCGEWLFILIFDNRGDE